VTLGDLYKETGDDGRAIDAYRRAVGTAPGEVATQRKLIALLDKVRPTEALAQHEAAARVAPGDADLQLELAKRYHPAQSAKAFATLEALARRMSQNVSVRRAIAALYEQWDALDRAIGEYQAIAAAEPDDPEHAIVLGDAYWRASDRARALRAWQLLDKIGTPASLLRHAQVLAMHEAWVDAVTAYTKALAADGTNADAWYGRAQAHDALTRYAEAVEDARRAVALTGYATHADGLRNRGLLVRELGRLHASGDRGRLTTAVATWRFAFDRGDAAAGYLLAAHHARLASHQLHDVLVKLYRLVPTDDSLGIALARSFVRRGKFARAVEELEKIARRSPARTEEIGEMIAQVDKDRERTERELRWAEEGRSSRHNTAGPPDLVGRERRFGMRLEIGGDVRGAAGALVGFGLYRTHRVARGTTVPLRFDWTKRNHQMEELSALAFGGGIATRLVDARKLELAIGIGARAELRYGSTAASSAFDRGALAADLSLELLPRAVPATLGLRYEQSLTDSARSSALFVELGFEAR
jgi:tetratricopeptide (TPR) repeat protein